MINQGPQVARALDQRVEAVGPNLRLVSGACWPRDARIVMPILGLPGVDERLGLLGVIMSSLKIIQTRPLQFKPRL